MACKGECPKYVSPVTTGVGKYRKGLKRCQVCEIFVKWEGYWCPCCGYRLRTKPRNRVYKEKLRGDYVEPSVDIPVKNDFISPSLRTNKSHTRTRECRCTCHFGENGSMTFPTPCDFCRKYHKIKNV